MANSHQRTSHGKPLLILHVNDSTDDQVIYQAAAKKAAVPIEWHVADSAKRAISYLKSLLELSRRHEPRWVDLVLLDLVMPGEGGLAVLRYIRDTPKLRPVPVVILTGQMDPVILKEACDIGVNALHEKPAKFDDSVTLVRTLYTHWSSAMRPTRA